MNPYDFVSIDWNNPPKRHKPVWHHRLTGLGSQHLFSGYIEFDIYAETPLFIADPHSHQNRVEQPVKNMLDEYIIPGSSLKGMLRTVVETLGNGCLTLFDQKYEKDKVNFSNKVPGKFQRCKDSTNLCIACRIFGMLRVGKGREESNGNEGDGKTVFLGKINIGDAIVDKASITIENPVTEREEIKLHKPIFTLALMNPKPHHEEFYLDPTKTYIAGRKFYFHQKALLTPENPGNYNRYIQPLDSGTKFKVRIDFTNLEEAEFGALLLALTLEEKMRHKIGYGKPMGLGTIKIVPTSLTLIDYATRYTQPDKNRGKTTLSENELLRTIKPHIAAFSATHLSQTAMTDLRRIWTWPPNNTVEYYYPSKSDWFDKHALSKGKRIVDTRNVSRQP